MKIQFLNEYAQLPERATSGSCGYDLHAAIADTVKIPPSSSVTIPTGLAMEIPAGIGGFVFPRSGLAKKQNLRLANCVGVIDSDYRGEICVVVHNDNPEEFRYIEPGERIAQMVLMPYLWVSEWEQVDKLSTSDRGEGGFGSTGTN